MDVYCQFCGEPWDLDSVGEFEQDGELPGATMEFYSGKGCPSCHWGKDTEKKNESYRTAAMAALTDCLGDDTDGIAAMMEDIDFLLDE